MITEIGFPAVDASSKDTGLMSIKIKADHIRSNVVRKPASVKPNRSRPWQSSNFRLEMEGLDTSRVTRVEPFAIKRQIPEGSRRFEREPSRLETSNLKITLSEQFAASWQDWHEDFVIRGDNDDGQEKSGSLIFLSPDMKSELGRVNLNQCGIYRLSEAKSASGLLIPGFVTAELYCEQMTLKLSSGR